MAENCGRSSLIFSHRVGLLALSLFFLKEKIKDIAAIPYAESALGEHLFY